jgi:hypothetical protein
MIAADTTKEAHSNQKIDLPTVRWQVFRGTMDYLLRVWPYIVRIIHLGVADFSNAMEIARYFDSRYGTLVS